MIERGLCSVPASYCYYPAPILAAFRLAADGVLTLPQAWDLISGAPARPAGRLVYLSDGDRLRAVRAPRHAAVAAE